MLNVVIPQLNISHICENDMLCGAGEVEEMGWSAAV